MERHELPESHWLKLEPLLPGRRGAQGRAAKDNRNFLNAVWHLCKTGEPWRDLPERFGKWDTVCHRFNQWCKKGVWQRLFEAVRNEPDMEWLMMDSTVIRAHPHAAGMNNEADDQALGRSRGGFGTKIHLAVDALGNPVTVTLSPGQDADISRAEELLADHEPEKVLADKGCDSDAFVKTVEEKGAEAVIPPRKNRKNPREYDKDVCKERNKVERTVGLLKQCRRVATRYEKTARNFLGIVLFAAITDRSAKEIKNNAAYTEGWKTSISSRTTGVSGVGCEPGI